MEVPELNDFSLVGGTALALIYGHRESIDLDLFSHKPINNSEIVSSLENKFGDSFVVQINREKFGVFGFVSDVKVDIVKHPYPLIGEIQITDGIRIYSIADIAAMKVKAILGRGKKKDFWDIYELLHHYSVKELSDFYYQKFPEQLLLIGIPYALIYFTDAEETEEPVSLKGQTWDKVKKFIEKKTREYLRR